MVGDCCTPRQKYSTTRSVLFRWGQAEPHWCLDDAYTWKYLCVHMTIHWCLWKLLPSLVAHSISRMPDWILGPLIVKSTSESRVMCIQMLEFSTFFLFDSLQYLFHDVVLFFGKYYCLQMSYPFFFSMKFNAVIFSTKLPSQLTSNYWLYVQLGLLKETVYIAI